VTTVNNVPRLLWLLYYYVIQSGAAVRPAFIHSRRREAVSSSENYDRLRTSPEIFFAILDECLASGDRSLATDRALVSYEDRVMAAVSHYIRGEPNDGRRALREVQIGAILRTPQVRQWRLLVLIAGLWGCSGCRGSRRSDG
jgi:hypothetical protein